MTCCLHCASYDLQDSFHCWRPSVLVIQGEEAWLSFYNQVYTRRCIAHQQQKTNRKRVSLDPARETLTLFMLQLGSTRSKATSLFLSRWRWISNASAANFALDRVLDIYSKVLMLCCLLQMKLINALLDQPLDLRKSKLVSAASLGAGLCRRPHHVHITFIPSLMH